MTFIKGYKPNKEVRDKLSQALKGNQNGKGHYHTEEYKLKMSIAKKGKTFNKEHKKNLSIAHLGYKPTSETIAKMKLRIGEKHNRWKGGNKWTLKGRESLAGRPRAELCEICGSGGKIVYDHDHATGKFRGWICSHCNTSLGFARDNIEVLYKMINYLNQSRGLIVINQNELSTNSQQPQI